MGARAGKIQQMLVLIWVAAVPAMAQAHAVGHVVGQPDISATPSRANLAQASLPDFRIYQTAYPVPVAINRSTYVFPSFSSASGRSDVPGELSKTYALLLSSFGMLGLISLRRLTGFF